MFSLSFIYVFLPISVILYYLTPNIFKPTTLTIISIGFIALTSIKSIPYLILWILIDYIFGILMQRFNKNKFFRNLIFFMGLIKNIGVFVYISIIREISAEAIPFGMAVYSLIGLGYIINVHKKPNIAETNITRYFAYALFFPNLFYGPLTEYEEIKKQFIHIKPSLTAISKGIVIFIFGLAKKIIIADYMVELYNSLLNLPKYNLSVVGGWTLMISFAFSLYFTLSGYFDVARGIGMIYSIKMPISFFHPFQARSIDEFFARFNITLNEYVRRYIYVELGEKSNGKLSAMFNIMLVSMLISVWYGLRINTLIWGIYLGIFIILEQYVYGKYWKKMPLTIQRILTFCITMMSFSVLNGNSLEQSLFYLKTMFGLNNNPITDLDTLYMLYSNYLVMIIGFIMCSGIGTNLSKFMNKKKSVIWEMAGVCYNIFLLICISGFLIK